MALQKNRHKTFMHEMRRDLCEAVESIANHNNNTSEVEKGDPCYVGFLEKKITWFQERFSSELEAYGRETYPEKDWQEFIPYEPQVSSRSNETCVAEETETDCSMPTADQQCHQERDTTFNDFKSKSKKILSEDLTIDDYNSKSKLPPSEELQFPPVATETGAPEDTAIDCLLPTDQQPHQERGPLFDNFKSKLELVLSAEFQVQPDATETGAPEDTEIDCLLPTDQQPHQERGPLFDHFKSKSELVLSAEFQVQPDATETINYGIHNWQVDNTDRELVYTEETSQVPYQGYETINYGIHNWQVDNTDRELVYTEETSQVPYQAYETADIIPLVLVSSTKCNIDFN